MSVGLLYYLIILLALMLLSYYAFKLESKIMMLVVALSGLVLVKFPDLLEIDTAAYYELSLLKEKYSDNVEVMDALREALSDGKIVLSERSKIMEIISPLHKKQMKDYYTQIKCKCQ